MSVSERLAAEEEREGRREDGEGGGERKAMQEREKLRIERRKEAEREMRKENMKGSLRKSKADRDDDRDVSEKVALGMHVGSGKLTGDELYDSRLFNQGSGVGTGFGGDDEYNVYSNNLFDKGAGASIYRPRGNAGIEDEAEGDRQYDKIAHADKFRPDRGFAGADYAGGGMARDKPVQFEKEGSGRKREREGENKGREEAEEDFFGLGDIVGNGRRDPLGHIGGKGMMSGSAAGSREDLEMGQGKRQRIGFHEAGGRRRRE